MPQDEPIRRHARKAFHSVSMSEFRSIASHILSSLLSLLYFTCFLLAKTLVCLVLVFLVVIVPPALLWRHIFLPRRGTFYPEVTTHEVNAMSRGHGIENHVNGNRGKDKDTFTIMTFNIAGLPPHVNVNPPTRRLKEYFQKLGKLDCSELPTVICLQEAFFSSLTEDIIPSALRSHYPHMVLHPLPIHPSIPLLAPYLEMNSGLVVLSKEPIAWTKAEPFGNCVGSDRQSNKGVVVVAIRIWGKLVLFYTTHLQSDPCNDPLWWLTPSPLAAARAARSSQISQMSRFLKSSLPSFESSEEQASAVVVCGDLNVAGERLEVAASSESGAPKEVFVYANPEYSFLTKSLQDGLPKGMTLVDCSAPKNVSRPMKEGKKVGIEHVGITCLPLTSLERIDYVMSAGKVQCEKVTIDENRWGDSKYFSDHASLTAHFKLI